MIELTLPDAGPPRGGQRHGRGRPRPRGAAARAARLRRRSGRTTRTATCATSCCRRRAADDRVPARPAGRRAGRQGTRASASRTTPQGKVEQDRAGLHGDPLLRLGQPRPGEMAVWISNRRPARGRSRCRPLASRARSPRRTSRATTTSPSRRTDGDQRRRRSAGLGRPAPSSTGGPRRAARSGSSTRSPAPTSVSEVEVYWFDDTGSGECRVPASWRVLYKDGEEWKPVEGAEPYGVEKDRYNKVTFKPVTTSALRLEVTLQPEWSAGIQEWKVK